MSFDNSLFEYDAGYYEFMPGRWLGGRMHEHSEFTWSKEAVEKAVTVPLVDTDCIFATYPKTGQTWTLGIIRLIKQWEAIEKGEEVQEVDNYQLIPFIETEWPGRVFGADIFSKLQHPRCLKTHLHYQLWKGQLEGHPKVKVIQTIRDPKDTLLSFFHHMRADTQLGAFNGTWDQYFELFKQKKLPWGDYFELNAEWYKFNKDRKESLVLRYEEMKKDPKGHVIKISKFLGYDLSDKVVDFIVEKTSFKNMSKKINDTLEGSAAWKADRSKFIRKGEVGGWAEVFSKEQVDYVEAQCKEYLEPLGLKF